MNISDTAQCSSNTMLMQSLIKKLITTRNKHILVELSLHNDECIAGIMYLLSMAKHTKQTHSVSSPSQLLLISQEHIPRILAFIDGLGPSEQVYHPTLIGNSSSPRQDIPALHRNSSVLISTPCRLIDHIRRKNIDVSHLQQVCTVQPIETHDAEFIESFASDLLYIATKLNRKVRLLSFSRNDEQFPSVNSLLRNPKTITRKDLGIQTRAVWYQAAILDPEVVSDYIYANQMDHVLIICSKETGYVQFTDYLTTHAPIYTVSVRRLSESMSIPSSIQHIVYADLSNDSENSSCLSCINPSLPGIHHFIVTTHNSHILSFIQENYTMNKQFTTPESKKILSGKIQLLIKEIEKDANPEDLNVLKHMIKKNVPFYRRGYVTAFLLRAYLQGTGSEKSSHRSSRTQIPAEDTATLFFGIGKNRRTYPKDIARLLKTEAALHNEDIASIKTLENYSFVSVHKDKAPQAIEKLNGFTYKGRTLIVNYAKSKAK